MKILVLNCGSSSLKYQLINMETEEVLASGKYERIGEQEAFITHKACGKKVTINHVALDHTEAIDFTLKQLTNPEYKVIDSLDEVNAIGHRLVHGGEKISQSVIIDKNVVNVLKECTDLAPLHNPAGIMGIEACQKVMPGKPMVGVFDTAFHQTMPKEHYIYPIAYEFYEKYGIRKYGFHGTSHMYVSNRLAEIKNSYLPFRSRFKYLCSRWRKICRYIYGAYSFRWNTNGYKKRGFRSFSCHIFNEKRKFNSRWC